jgi:hypothetical protein|nr:hypothetical protein [Ligilactobacillus acidipiscis]
MSRSCGSSERRRLLRAVLLAAEDGSGVSHSRAQVRLWWSVHYPASLYWVRKQARVCFEAEW